MGICEGGCLKKKTKMRVSNRKASTVVMVSPGILLVKNHESHSKNKKSCLGLYVSRQLIWRQTPKLFITVY